MASEAEVSGVPSAGRSHFVIEPSESAVLIEARSTIGRIDFGTQVIDGHVEAAEFDGGLVVTPAPYGSIRVDMRTFRSDNALYDAELAQRLDVQRFPIATATLEQATRVGDRFQVTGPVTLHGQTRQITGSVLITPADGGWVVSGEHVFDVRDFEMSVPSLLMLRIFPDVRIHMVLKLREAQVQARAQWEEREWS